MCILSAMATFGENIKRLRDARGWTQEELARRAKYKKQARISTLENNPIVPRAPTVRRFARAFGVDQKELLENVETHIDVLRSGQSPKPTPKRARDPALEPRTARSTRVRSS